MTRNTVLKVLVKPAGVIFVPIISSFFVIFSSALSALVVFPLAKSFLGFDENLFQYFAAYIPFLLFIFLTVIVLIKLKNEILKRIRNSKLIFILASFFFYVAYSPLMGWYSGRQNIISEYSNNFWYFINRISPFYPFSLVGQAYLEGSLKIPDGYIPVPFGEHAGWNTIVTLDTFLFLIIISIIHGLLLTIFLAKFVDKIQPNRVSS